MTTNNRAISLAALLLAVVVAVPQASATVMQAASFDDKVSNAAAIVLGHVTKKESRWDSQHRWILTYTTLRIEKAYKGVPTDQEITVVTPGGQVGDVLQDTNGVPDLQMGTDNVLFVRNTSEGPTVLYFDQGAYDVEKEGNERVIKPVETDAVKVDSQTAMAVTTEEPKTLAQFEHAVRDSEKRTTFNRMELIKRQQRQPQSLASTLGRYKYLIALALLGAAVATWQLFRR